MVRTRYSTQSQSSVFAGHEGWRRHMQNSMLDPVYLKSETLFNMLCYY
jgi:hypothetical protein